MNAVLDASDFPQFFEELWGRPPFRWQTRLAEEVLSDRGWPTVLDLPTGSGKTAALDVAVFTLAARPADAPRRIVFVVDRRLIVDQTTDRARSIADQLVGALRDGGDTTLHRVASALQGLISTEADHDRPLEVASLRGGMRIGSTWARNPTQPTVMVSTVDQFGSRLMFRGYGVSPRMRPVHAGLCGNDCLVLLDEVHLSTAFAQTALDIEGSPGFVRGLPRRWRIVQMSATPVGSGRTGDESSARTFSLGAEDLNGRDEELTRRLTGRRSARLLPIGRRNQAPEDALAMHVPPLLDEFDPEAPVIGVVVNRVRSARAVYDALRERGVEALLLTGRMRQVDRQRVQAEVVHLADPDRADAPVDRPVKRLVVVATQCIEVGADLSFDGMITEIAPPSSLRQRFGRLDRRGRAAAAGRPVEAMIVATESTLNERRPDPVYGSTVQECWRRLHARHAEGEFDVGPMADGLSELDDIDRELHRSAIQLMPGHLDLLVQTNPPPSVEPEVADYLHGVTDDDPDVSIVWRADVDPEKRDEATAVLQAVPPLAAEALTVPLSALRRWLRHAPPSEVADVDSSPPDESAGDRGSNDRRVLRWVPGELPNAIAANEIRPGDTCVVPCAWGGLSGATWDPTSQQTVDDVGLRAQLDATARTGGRRPRSTVLRVHVDITGRPSEDGADAPAEVATPTPADDEWPGHADPDARQAVEERLSQVDLPGDLHGALIDDVAPYTLVRRREDGELIEIESWLVTFGQRHVSAEDFDGSDETNSFTGVREPVLLRDHLSGVGRIAASFGRSCGLDDDLVGDLRLAGELHDIGKADRRFQEMLHGSEVQAAIGRNDPIAKSMRRPGQGPNPYPKGARHEFMSCELLAHQRALLNQAHDRDLVVHLVMTHHGHARAMPLVVPDPHPVRVQFTPADGDVLRASSALSTDSIGPESVERFWRLVERYGWHGLAWLEAIFRLADHRRSEQEARS